MAEYLDIGVKLAIGLISLIFQMNLLGKGNLAPTSSLDQLQNFVLGGIIGGMIYNTQVSVLQFFLILIMWTFLVALFKYLKETVGIVKKLIDGSPMVVIKNGEVLVENCAKKGIAASDLMFKLRDSGIYDTRQVKRAVQEQNGQFTIILYGDKQVRFPVITNGFVDEDVLENFDKNREWLDQELAKQGVELTHVYLGEYHNGRLNLSLYNK